MGNKVNPLGYRLGIQHTWNSRWFVSDKGQYKKYLLQDLIIRKTLMSQFTNAGLVSVEIERNLSGMRITMYAVRPGIIIGRGGKGLDQVKKMVLSHVGAISKIEKDKIDLWLTTIKDINYQ